MQQCLTPHTLSSEWSWKGFGHVLRYASRTLTRLSLGCATPPHAQPLAPLRSGAWALLSSRQPPCLTEGLSKILAEADVGELQHLAPFLALAFPVSATACGAHRIGTTS